MRWCSAINQNFVFHPTYRTARRILSAGAAAAGPDPVAARGVQPTPRQLGARQFGHWMFREPVNILLEQAVHPLSQIIEPAGRAVRGQGRPGQAIANRSPADTSMTAGPRTCCAARPRLSCPLAFGQSFHAWRFTAVCDDGALVCDLSRPGGVMVQGRGQWPEFLDNMPGWDRAVSAHIAGQSIAGAVGYITGLLKLRPKSDGFFVSMRDSIAAFYRGIDARSRRRSTGTFRNETLVGYLSTKLA